VLLAPEASVQEHRDGKRAGAVGQVHIGELVDVGSVPVTHTMTGRMAQAPKTWIPPGVPA
jgi:hypothetical protein